jgi:hypothetical protein
MTKKTPAELQIQLENEMDELENDLDPIPVSNAVMMIADNADIDLEQLIDNLLQGKQYRWGMESVIQDILESSQSNLDRALLSLRRISILETKISEL